MTHEAQLALFREAPPAACLLVDALGTWLAARIAPRIDLLEIDYTVLESQLDDEAAQFVDAMLASPAYVIAVSEQIGWDVVPVAASARLFRDAMGRMVQRLAKRARTRLPRRRGIRARFARGRRADRLRRLARCLKRSSSLRFSRRSSCLAVVAKRLRIPYPIAFVIGGVGVGVSRGTSAAALRSRPHHAAGRPAAALQRGMVDRLVRAQAQRAADRAARGGPGHLYHGGRRGRRALHRSRRLPGRWRSRSARSFRRPTPSRRKRFSSESRFRGASPRSSAASVWSTTRPRWCSIVLRWPPRFPGTFSLAQRERRVRRRGRRRHPRRHCGRLRSRSECCATCARRGFGDAMIASVVFLLAPFAAYLPAEELHVSGVLAAVSAGHSAEPAVDDVSSILKRACSARRSGGCSPSCSTRLRFC